MHALQNYDIQTIYSGVDSVQLDSVIRTLTVKHQKHPSNLLFIRHLAEAYTAKHDVDSALTYWESVTTRQPANDTSLFIQAQLYYVLDSLKRSSQLCTQALELAPNTISYMQLMGWANYRLHDLDRAMGTCNNIIGLQPSNVNALLLSGIILRDQKNNAEALDRFDACLKADPANTEALMHRAEIFVFLKKYNDALRDYTAARADLSTNADIINDLGICYYQSGSYQKAITFFKKAIFLNSRHPQSNFNKGISYYSLNDFDSASIDMKSAATIWDSCQTDTCHANFLDAIYYLGMCYKKTGDLPAAKSHFELLQKEGYPRDLRPEIKHIEYALFISRNWYYIVAALVLFIVLLITVFRAMRRK